MARLLRIRELGVAVGLMIAAATQGQQLEAPDTLYRNGIGAFSSGNYVDAARSFQELIARFGQEPSLQNEMEGVYYALGCSQYNLGQYPEAVETFKTYAQRFPSAKYLDEALFRIGAALQAQESYEAAIAGYRQLIEKMPRSSYAEDSLYQIAICRMLQGRFDQAAPAFADFIQSFPDSELRAQAMLFMARSLFEAGKLAEAVDALAALEGRGRSWDTLVYANFLAFEIGDLAYDNTDYDLALRAYRRIRTRQSLIDLQRRLVKNLEAALEAFARERPDPAALGARFRREQRLASALRSARDMRDKLETGPDYDAGLFHRIGRCFFNDDRYWEARVAFARAVAAATDDNIREAAHFDLILCLSRMRRFEDLIAEADRYLKTYDDTGG